MTVDIRSPAFRDIVGDALELEQLGTGFDFTEGPVWHPYEKHLIFSDIPGDHLRRWDPRRGISTFRRPANMANGNCYDLQGRLLSCEHATSRVTRTELDGSITILATHYDGKELNSPNDVVVAPDGGIYFTDPTYGRNPYFGVPRQPELGFQGVYRIVPDAADGHEIQLVADDFAQPNGLCFTLDRRGLFVDDTDRGHIRYFDVAEDGSLSGGRVWAELTGDAEGVADGIKVDSEGNVYCTGPGGVHVFDAEARLLGIILVPEVVANFSFGDEDLRSLFLTATSSLYRVRVKIPGQVPF
jgi:gluconolactonase